MSDFLYEQLVRRGLTRRDFMKYCGEIAALIGLSEMYIPQIARALETAAKRQPVVWLEFAMCTGCTESLIKTTNPSAASIVLDILSINYWETVMAPAGEQAEKSLKDTVDEGGYIVIVEGSLPTGADGHYLTIGGKTGVEIAKEVVKKAAVTIQVGYCATFGGPQSAKPNPTEVKTVAEVVGIEPINITGCPHNPYWVVGTIVHYLLLGKVPELDQFNRPKIFFGQTIHENCPRRGNFDDGKFVEQFGSKEEDLGYCLYKMGCKGPETHADCWKRNWNDHLNWCIGAGAPCLGCNEPDWMDVFSGFYERLPGVELPGTEGIKTTADTIGKVAGVATAVGIGAHFIGQAATGRLGKGGPQEGGEK